MKSLYETILDSTGSGKKAKVSEKYFLEKGFHKTREGGALEIILQDGYYYYLYPWKDKWYVRISRIEKGIIKDTKHFVETYADFDLVMDYWNAVSNKLPFDTINQKKELVKNTLKRF